MSKNLKNIYIEAYINNIILAFRKYNDNTFDLSINGLKPFFRKDEEISYDLLEQLKRNGFNVNLLGSEQTASTLKVHYCNQNNSEIESFDVQITNLPSLIELSSKTKIPLLGIIIMRVVSQLIHKFKTLYKAFVFDLDDTLWPGTLSEDGIQQIDENLHSNQGVSFVEFMKYIKLLARELGVFIAICSRNDIKKVESAIEYLDEEVFPLKGEIDCVIANNNDKSDNIKAIALQLSILPNSIVFIDDNKIIRDEVKNKIPNIFVPDWINHDKLILLLNAACTFERYELSLNSQNRRRNYKILQTERIQNQLPILYVKINDDNNHSQALRLYSKSNQFKLNSKHIQGKDTKSIYFDIYRENKESLGLCSVLTYSMTPKSVFIQNWAISCKYFEIGLEEYILLHIKSIAESKRIFIKYQKSEYNAKVFEMTNKYSGLFINTQQEDMLELKLTCETETKLRTNTNLKSL